MQTEWPTEIRTRLEARRDELTARLERITANLRRPLDSDSEERAKQLEDSEVVDALGNEARTELESVKAALRRMDDGVYGICKACGGAIAAARLEARPFASTCIECAELDEEFGPRG